MRVRSIKWLVLMCAIVASVCMVADVKAEAKTPAPMLAAMIIPETAAAADGTRMEALEKKVAEQDKAIAAAQSSGDNSWMLVSSALVLMMTGPGLALFYGGLVRKKNVLGTMMQSFAMMAVVTVLWVLVGYSLAFGVGSGHLAAFIGGFHNMFLK